jgi:hypothetical protein
VLLRPRTPELAVSLAERDTAPDTLDLNLERQAA